MLKKKEQESGGKFLRRTISDRLNNPNKCLVLGENFLITAQVQISAQVRLSAQLKLGANLKHRNRRIFVIYDFSCLKPFVVFIFFIFNKRPGPIKRTV